MEARESLTAPGAATLKAKLGQAPERARAGVDFARGERAQAVQPKPLDREAAHHRPIDDGAPQRCVAGAACDAALRRAIVYGSVMGSFTVERFGLDRLRTLTPREINARARPFWRLTQFRL